MKRRHFYPPAPSRPILADAADRNDKTVGQAVRLVQNAFDWFLAVTESPEFVRRISTTVDISKEERHPLAMVFGDLATGYREMGISPDSEMVFRLGFAVRNPDTSEGRTLIKEINLAFLVATSKQQRLLPELQVRRLPRH